MVIEDEKKYTDSWFRTQKPSVITFGDLATQDVFLIKNWYFLNKYQFFFINDQFLKIKDIFLAIWPLKSNVTSIYTWSRAIHYCCR